MAEGRPSQFKTVWVKVSESSLTGEYEMVSQGARIYGLTYTIREEVFIRSGHHHGYVARERL